MQINFQNLTDQQRQQITTDDVIASGKSFFVDIKEFEREARQYLKNIPNGTEYFKNSQNFYDAIKPYLDATQTQSAVIFDLRRQQYPSVIAYVNGGANDFNSVQWDKKTGRSYIPSAMVAAHFISLMDTKDTMEKEFPGIEIGHQQASKDTLKGNYNIVLNNLNDLLYVYQHLRDNKKGLNWKSLEKEKDLISRWGIKDIKSVFAQMDKILEKPENERFQKPVKKETRKKTVMNIITRSKER